jgi:hypothetical protein
MIVAEWFPSRACDFIESYPIAGPMINDVDYGGYITYRLWPKQKVFVDTRIHPFLNGTWEESWVAFQCTRPLAWFLVFKKYQPNVVVLSPKLPLVSILAERKDWIPVYFDRQAIVFVRNIAENKEAIINRQRL